MASLEQQETRNKIAYEEGCQKIKNPTRKINKHDTKALTSKASNAFPRYMFKDQKEYR